jgi:hypothetical protein
MRARDDAADAEVWLASLLQAGQLVIGEANCDGKNCVYALAEEEV